MEKLIYKAPHYTNNIKHVYNFSPNGQASTVFTLWSIIHIAVLIKISCTITNILLIVEALATTNLFSILFFSNKIIKIKKNY